MWLAWPSLNIFEKKPSNNKYIKEKDEPISMRISKEIFLFFSSNTEQ